MEQTEHKQYSISKEERTKLETSLENSIQSLIENFEEKHNCSVIIQLPKKLGRHIHVLCNISIWD